MLNHFLGMHKYETWASSLTIDSIDTVPQSARNSPQFLRAIQVMAHIQIARRVWLARLKNEAWRVDDWFPAWPIADSRREALELDNAWSSFLASLSGADLSMACRYTSSEGVRYESSISDIIAHVLNHSTYHRGQIARLVSEAGGRRAGTDLIAMTRRQL
ncbi:MAG: DinB family protein [Planctomycetota bacterium]